MLSYEQDPDVVRWGLQLFDGDPYSNCGYCSTIPQNNTGCYENHYGSVFSNVEENELAANSLEQQFSYFTLTDQPQDFLQGVENAQTSCYQQQWFNQSMENYPFDENGNEEETDLVTSSAYPTPGGESYSGEWSYSTELMDENALDGELGRRLNQMVPIPHIPRINGDIPSLDEATLDHQRLLERLQVYQLVECKIQGDGNCQFRALSDQFYRTPEHHEFVRQEVVDQLKSCPETYEGYVPMAYDDYLEKMSKNGEWGDHVTLQAAADSYGVKIFVITSFKDTCYIEILPSIQKSERVIAPLRKVVFIHNSLVLDILLETSESGLIHGALIAVIFLSFWAEVHYNSIYPEGDLTTFGTKRKKRRSFPRQEHFETTDDCS